MEVILLGSAAGGGFPQWNCWCASCRTARDAPDKAHPRTQSSIAVSADGIHWFLCNASPDVREQVTRIPSSRAPSKGVRDVPIEGVILTDAELDHTVGLLLLREARQLTVYSTPAVETILYDDSRILPTMRAFADVNVVHLPYGPKSPPLALSDRSGQTAGLTVETISVAGGAPRFAHTAHDGHTVGLIIRHPATATALAYVPGVGAIDDLLMRQLDAVDCILFDGTCYTDDELIAEGISSVTARQMGHVPISGENGSLAALQTLAPRQCIYTHINNTNPILVEDSAERRAVEHGGVTVGDDGLRLTVRGIHRNIEP
jgi:pyrroloquinoline quinone biosynthesis protein B